MKQKSHITKFVIRARVVYNFYIVAILHSTIEQLNKELSKLQKFICGISKNASNISTQLHYNFFKLYAFSLEKCLH